MKRTLIVIGSSLSLAAAIANYGEKNAENQLRIVGSDGRFGSAASQPNLAGSIPAGSLSRGSRNRHALAVWPHRLEAPGRQRHGEAFPTRESGPPADAAAQVKITPFRNVLRGEPG
jgi:hypothetical protein